MIQTTILHPPFNHGTDRLHPKYGITLGIITLIWITATFPALAKPPLVRLMTTVWHTPHLLPVGSQPHLRHPSLLPNPQWSGMQEEQVWPPTLATHMQLPSTMSQSCPRDPEGLQAQPEEGGRDRETVSTYSRGWFVTATGSHYPIMCTRKVVVAGGSSFALAIPGSLTLMLISLTV